MSYAIGVAILVVGLLVSIALHEVGHLVPAKRFGVKVPVYAVGFGRTLWSTVRGGTEYAVKALPLGGYVRLAGMYPPSVGSPSRRPDGRLTMVEDARQETLADLGPGEEHRAFYALTVPRKLVVMAGGPLMNLLIAAVLLVVMQVGLGAPTPSATVQTVLPCVTTTGTCEDGDPASPAAVAGFQPGDRIIRWGGAEVRSWSDVTAEIRASGTAGVDVVVERDGRTTTLVVVPVEVERVLTDEAGRPLTDDDGNQVTQVLPYVGIQPRFELQPASLGEVPGIMWYATTQTFGVILQLPQEMWRLAESLVTGGERDGELIGLLGAGRIAGEIASVPSEQYGLAERTYDMLGLLVSLNIALFAFNVIPLPPLDGGHVAGALVEGTRKGWARLRGMPVPRPVDMARVLPLTYGVVVALVGMGLLLAWADIVRPVAF